MTDRVSIIEDTAFIAERVRKLRVERDTATVVADAAAACDCPSHYDVHGVYHKLHVPGCMSGAARFALSPSAGFWVVRP